MKPKYTHRDALGMRWRMEGGRPVSELADRVMRECQLKPKTKKRKDSK